MVIIQKLSDMVMWMCKYGKKRNNCWQMETCKIFYYKSSGFYRDPANL